MDTVKFRLGSPANALTGWTLAIVSEGYTRKELDLGLFTSDVTTFLEEFFDTPPFSDPALWPRLNLIEVSVESRKSGTEIERIPVDPVHPERTVSPFGTAFEALFGRDHFNGNPIERSLWGKSEEVKQRVKQLTGLTGIQGFLVIVNNTELRGGSMHDGVGWRSKFRSPPPAVEDWPTVAIHELGHQAFRLADEYSVTLGAADAVREWPVGNEPGEPNVTANTNVPTMKWGGLVTLPQTLVPTTEPSPVCARDHPVLTTLPPIPADAIGAYEGAHHYHCRVYRPALDCKMRTSVRRFCRVCEAHLRRELGHLFVRPGGGSTHPAGSWTHAQSFEQAGIPRMLFYNAGTPAGDYAISDTAGFSRPARRPDGTLPLIASDPSIGTGSIGADWTWLAPFTLNGSICYLAHQFGSGRQAIFKMSANGVRLTETWSSGPGPTWTHLVTLTLDGSPHYISYNGFTGEAWLFRINTEATDPELRNTMMWARHHTALLSVTVDGTPFVLTYRLITGEVELRRIEAAGFVNEFAGWSGFWRPDVTHLAWLERAGRPFVLRYSATDGEGSVWHVRSRGKGLDFVCTIKPPLGIGGLSILGVGAPALGDFRIPVAGGAAVAIGFFLYKALGGTLRMMFL
jgi:hypothetical protein